MKKEKIIILIIVIILIGGLTILYKFKDIGSEYDFKIYFFNAGKADAILISKNDKYIMIDTGEDNLSDEILKYFNSNNITRLEYLIITHFDKDHVGSASSIINNIEIGEVLQSNSPKESDEYTSYLEALSNKNITPTTVSGDYQITLDDINITVNGPTDIYDSNESNNSSLIVSIINGKNSFLFMGDAQNPRIKDYISSNTNTFDFIKIPYHGNYLKRLDDLLDSTSPIYGLMTCSNSEGCEDETIKVLDQYNIKYYMTKNGSITVLSDGTNIKIRQ